MKSKMNLFSTLTVMLILMLTHNSEAQSLQSDMKVLSPKAAYELIDSGTLFVDVREKDELFDISYDIPNVINVPLSELENRFSEIPNNKQVILMCKTGNRSAKAYSFLLSKGYVDIINMEGGMELWSAAGFPVMNTKISKSACCAKPNSKDCNPDGTCKPKVSDSKSACCSSSKSQISKACCSSKKEN